jgi:hypothetical protein
MAATAAFAGETEGEGSDYSAAKRGQNQGAAHAAKVGEIKQFEVADTFRLRR